MLAYQSRTLLDRGLRDIGDSTQQLNSMVLFALDQAMDALYDRDTQAAKLVIDNDEKVNELRFQIEEDCVLLLATQQPAATDLRVILAATHIAGELERIGDHATSIADVVLRMDGEAPIDSLHKLPKMAKHARRMVEDSVEAFIMRDAEPIASIQRREDKLDMHYSNLFTETIDDLHNDEYVHRATLLLWVGRHLERIGDRATNIAERVLFLTDGRFIEIQ